MKTESFSVSYRDKNTNTNVKLDDIELDIPETVAEATELFGEEDFLDYAIKAYVIEQQRIARDANRPDKPKSNTNLAKFRRLTPKQQEELLAMLEDARLEDKEIDKEENLEEKE